MSRPEVAAHYSTAANMWLDYGQAMPAGEYDASDLYLKSGLPFSLFLLSSQNQQEGEAIAVVAGDFDTLEATPDGPLMRMHSACIFSELGENPEIQERLQYSNDPHDLMYMDSKPSPDCDCKAQRIESQRMIATEGGIYVDLIEQEGRGAGLEVKREAYKLHREEGLDTVDAYERLGVPFDTRKYGHCARFLVEKGISHVRLLSNNPRKIAALADASIRVTPTPLIVGVSDANVDYLRTKRDKAGHIFGEL